MDWPAFAAAVARLSVNPAPVILSGKGVPCSRLAHNKGIPSATLKFASFTNRSRSGCSLMTRRCWTFGVAIRSADAGPNARGDVGCHLSLGDTVYANAHQRYSGRSLEEERRRFRQRGNECERPLHSMRSVGARSRCAMFDARIFLRRVGSRRRPFSIKRRTFGINARGERESGGNLGGGRATGHLRQIRRGQEVALTFFKIVEDNANRRSVRGFTATDFAGDRRTVVDFGETACSVGFQHIYTAQRTGIYLDLVEHYGMWSARFAMRKRTMKRGRADKPNVDEQRQG